MENASAWINALHNRAHIPWGLLELLNLLHRLII